MNQFNKNTGGKSLKILPLVFEKMHNELIKGFSSEYSTDPEILLDYQLYGFDQYNESKPNLKEYIRLKTNTQVNGKYLYNKVRDNKNRRKEIKLTREYTYIYFNAIGYKDIFEFIGSSLFKDKERQAQLKLFGAYQEDNFDDEYYIGYYYGEDHKIIKTKLTIYNNYKNVDWILIYWEKENEPSRYIYKGIVTEVKGTIAFYFSIENATTERNVLISIFFGNRNIINKPFLLGVYSGFDRNNCPVAGETIFQRVSSAYEQEKSILSKSIDLTIRNEIVNRRFIVSATLPQNKFELSEDSIYANRLSNYSGKYIGFLMKTGSEKMEQISLTIEEDSNEASLSFPDNRTYKGFFKLINKGEVMHGFFDIAKSHNGFNVVLNSNFYKEDFLLGIYSGIGQNNRPIGGRICFLKSNSNGLPQTDTSEGSTPTVNNAEEFNMRFRFLGNFFLGNKDQFTTSLNSLNKLKEKLDDNQKSGIDLISAVSGVYELYYQDENEDFVIKDILSIEENGNISIQTSSYIYHGNSKIFGDGMLSINITSHQHQEFYSQILIFVGRYQQDEIKTLSGIYNTISKDYSPMALKVVLIKVSENFKSLIGERHKIKSQDIKALSERFPIFKKLLIDSKKEIIKTQRLVN